MRRCAAWMMGLVASVAVAQAPVKTESGDLTGVRSGNVRTYLGVPFAAPPVGNLRWKAPQPVVRSAAVLAADKPGPACVQVLSRSHLPWTEAFMVQNNASEDCLSVNIWAPAKGGKHAVLVFFHGGAFNEGSNSIASYDGTALAEHGVIVVDANYRLGILGYLATTALAEESGHGSAGNYGLADQIAALGWVQRNIAAFGGDPARVTIAGQSAGAQSVAQLIASPRAKGLFAGAIMNSGPPVWPATSITRLPEAEAAGDKFTQAHGGSLAALRAMAAEDLLNAKDAPPRRPVVDGWWLTEEPGDDLRTPVGSDVPVLAGWNADEGGTAVPNGKTADAYRADAEKKMGADATRFLKLYPGEDDAQAAKSQVTAARDRNYAIAALYADAYVRRRASEVYLYDFSRVPPWKAHPEFGAHHTAELPYFFGTLDRVKDRDYDATDRAVSREAVAAWVAFAERGRPGPPWVLAHNGGGPFNVLGDTFKVESKLDSLRAAFWKSILSKP
ncbi:carboxylesterase type B [Terriglobus roseus DSM 18391]|uniref:Carboxylic ester hydrolase n=1 Tax=Terriglobus roseus (strain DSM 18391 / NRRL B-41598 / KBS 63) TaxID=926566 RepID=I3ZLP9_TERRK|nr:carboxylesterase family protein [Terriglobus roseus]AFL90167.1 carboxylesterase type B [Terriglobus roseus DSM 18391]